MDTATAAAVFAGTGLLWSIIWSIISANRLNRIQAEVIRNNRFHDQSVQQLYRARDAVITSQKAYMHLLQYMNAKKQDDISYFDKYAEWSAALAELRGIAIAINDREFLDLMNDPRMKLDIDNLIYSEVNMRTISQIMHTRITELLQNVTRL